LKIAAGVAGMMALLAVFAIQRLPGAERIVVEKPTIAERFDVEPLKKQARVIELVRPVASNDPVPVKTETIRPDPAPSVPKLVALPEDALDETGTEPKYSKRMKRQRVASVESNTCTRHHMRKVVTRGGKSWRCRR
jgi:hypothetical protein